MNEWLSAQLMRVESLNGSGSIALQKPPNRRHISSVPKPNKKVPPSKASSFGFFAIRRGPDPVTIAPKNLNGTSSSNISKDRTTKSMHANIHFYSLKMRYKGSLALTQADDLTEVNTLLVVDRGGLVIPMRSRTIAERTPRHW